MCDNPRLPHEMDESCNVNFGLPGKDTQKSLPKEAWTQRERTWRPVGSEKPDSIPKHLLLEFAALLGLE